MTDRVLALDLATSTGWCYSRNAFVDRGQLLLGRDIDTTPTESPMAYCHQLELWLEGLTPTPAVIVVEQGFHRGAGSEYLAMLRWTAQRFAYHTCARWMMVAQATWRKHARDNYSDLHSKSRKEDYHRVAKRVWGIDQGDVADARWLLDYYRSTEKMESVK